MRYWYHGNNQLFVLLLSLMQEASEYRKIIDHPDNQSDPDSVHEAQEFWKPAFDYFESFHDDAQGIWEMVVSPFSQPSKEEMQEFVAPDDEEDDDVGEHQALYRQSVMEDFRKSQDSDQKAAQYYERMEREAWSRSEQFEQNEQESVFSEEEEGLDDDGSDEEVIDVDESSEDEDEWVQEKMLKLESKKKSLSPQKHVTPISSGRAKVQNTQKVFHADDSPSDSEGDEEEGDHIALRAPSSSGRKRLVIQDSDEETT